MRTARETDARGARALVGLLLVGSVLGGCQATLPVERELAEGCLVNTDCREPLVCAFRRCHNACKTDRDCPRGLHCRSADKPLNVCMLDDELLCPGGRDRECPAEMVCGPDLVCRDACRSDRDCLADQACVQGVCANPTEVVDGGLPINPQGVVRCVLNSDCSSPLVCRAGGCVRECRENRDCAVGAFCADAGVCASGDTTPIATLTPERADAGALAVGYGEPCVVNSDCRNRALRCLGSRCGVECFEAVDCSASLGQCCTSLNRCAVGPACIPPDAGLFDPPTPDGGCRNDADCQDTARCNGAERCIERRCRAAEKPFCDDGNPCSLDMCSEVGPPCTYTSVRTDVDGDGRFPVACGGSADDCDDTDGNTFPGAPERCDYRDNNCNGAIDESLWRVKAGSRGTVGPSGAYPPGAGKPQAVMHRGEIVLVAASDTVRGTLDAYTVDPGSLSPSSGPLALGGSRTNWVQCGSLLGRRVALPTLITSGGQLLATALEASWPGTTCCVQPDIDTRSVFYRFFDTPLRQLDGGVLAQATSSLGLNACGSGNGPFTTNNRVFPGSTSYRPADDSWLFVWADVSQTNALPARLFATTVSSGVLAPPLEVWPPGANEPPAELPSQFSGSLVSERHMGSATAGNTTLFVWLNGPSPSVGRPGRLRAVLYDAALRRSLTVPRDVTTSTGLGMGTAIASVEAVAGRFLLATHPDTNAMALELREVLLDGGIQGSRVIRLSQSSPTAPSPGLWGATQPTLAYVDGGLLVASTDHAGGSSDNLRFQWTVPSMDAGTQSVLLPLGRSTVEHSDFALVPVNDRLAAAFWQDGDLQKVAFECAER